MQESRNVVWISSQTLLSIEEEAKRTFPKETGGVLIGYWVDRFAEVVITHATGPGPSAIHRPNSFLPDDNFQENEIARRYEESGRLHTYLGDWHTHPRQDAYLSPTDRATLRKIALHKDARSPAPLMAVLGDGRNWDLKIWRYEPSRFTRFGVRVKTVLMELRNYR